MLGVSLSGIEDVRAGRVGKRPQPATAEYFGRRLVLAASVAQPQPRHDALVTPASELIRTLRSGLWDSMAITWYSTIPRFESRCKC
jgi:hypothetical protein